MKLTELQQKLKAPKNQYNSFGKYNYRSCEDILEALKPILPDDATLYISDEVREVAGIAYVESSVKLSLDGNVYVSKAQAGINPDKKGMDISQSFGSSSSYARKYALNAMFLIDDTKDADSEDNSTQAKGSTAHENRIDEITDSIGSSKDVKELEGVWNKIPEALKKDFADMVKTRKAELV